jgi:hypothetical protein
VAGPLPRTRGHPHTAKDGTYNRLPLLERKLALTIMSSVKQKNLRQAGEIISHHSPGKPV